MRDAIIIHKINQMVEYVIQSKYLFSGWAAYELNLEKWEFVSSFKIGNLRNF